MKFRIVAELAEIREYEKKYLDNPKKVILEEDKNPQMELYLYYKNRQDAENFFGKLNQLFKEERKHKDTI